MGTAFDLTIDEAQTTWLDALRSRNWETKRLARVMFDDAAAVGATPYRPGPPAWRTVADPSNYGMGNRVAFTQLVADLMAQGAKKSKKGVPVSTPARPLSISEEDVVETIQKVVREVHAGHVPHEQVLRGAFIARLPEAHARAIGTPGCAVHAERKTPSTYQVKGTRAVRARYDLGFGHPTNNEGISGVVELKVFESLDGLLPVDGGLLQDFLKFVDTKLPPEAFRVSWALCRRRVSTGALPKVVEQLVSVLKIVEAARPELTVRKIEVDPATGWLSVSWEDRPRLQIAWYEPAAGDATGLEKLAWPLLPGLVVRSKFVGGPDEVPNFAG